MILINLIKNFFVTVLLVIFFNKPSYFYTCITTRIMCYFFKFFPFFLINTELFCFHFLVLLFALIMSLQCNYIINLLFGQKIFANCSGFVICYILKSPGIAE